MEEYAVPIERVVCCGGIAEKNDLFMQVYADVIGMPMLTAGSPQTPALGAAIAAAVAAGERAGGYDRFDAAQQRMTALGTRTFSPEAAAHAVYDELYALYRELHDSFGGVGAAQGDLPSLMKRLLQLRAGAAAGCLPGDNARRLLPRRRAGDPTADAGGGGAGVRAAHRARDRRDLSNTAAIGRRRSRRPRRQPRPLHLGGRSERRGGARPRARVPRSRGVPDLPHRRGRAGTRDVSRRQALRPQTRYGRVLRTAQRRRMSTLDWLIVAGYFAAIAALTSWVMKRRRDTTAAYFLARRHLGLFIEI